MTENIEAEVRLLVSQISERATQGGGMDRLTYDPYPRLLQHSRARRPPAGSKAARRRSAPCERASVPARLSPTAKQPSGPSASAPSDWASGSAGAGSTGRRLIRAVSMRVTLPCQS